jgi:hypothetical protein
MSPARWLRPFAPVVVAAPSGALRNVTFKLVIPTKAGAGSAAHKRVPAYVSPTTCTITITAPTGTDTFEIDTYDQPNTGSGPCAGNDLSNSSFEATIVAGQNNVITATLGGVPASVTVTPLASSGYLVGSQSGMIAYGDKSFSVAVVSYDADNNPIVGLGAPSLSLQGTSGLSVTAPAAGASQNIFSFKNVAFNTHEQLAATANPVAGTNGQPVVQAIPVETKHVVVYTLNPNNNAAYVYYDETAAASGNGDNGQVEMVTAGGTTTAATYTADILGPFACAVDPVDDSLWVVNLANSTVVQFPHGSTTPEQEFGLTGGGSYSDESIALDRFGTLYIGENNGSDVPQVQVYLLGTRSSDFVLNTYDPSGFWAPTGLAVDVAGNLWVGDFTNGSGGGAVQEFPGYVNASSSPTMLPYTPLNSLLGFAVNPSQ